MTENEAQEAVQQTSDSEAPPRPVTVPNVRPGAVSGLSGEVIGSAAQEAHDAQYPEEPGEADPFTVPSSEDREAFDAWVSGDVVEGDGDAIEGEPVARWEAYLARIRAVVDQESAKPEEEQDTDLLDYYAGLLHDLTGDDSDELLAIPDDVPDTVDGRSGWVHDAQDADTMVARAQAVLAAEYERDEDDRRSTLVEPLEALLAKQVADTSGAE